MHEKRGISYGILSRIYHKGFRCRTNATLDVRNRLDVADPAHAPYHMEISVRRVEDIATWLRMMEYEGLEQNLKELLAKQLFISVHAPFQHYGQDSKSDDAVLAPLRDIYRALPGLGPLVVHAEWLTDIHDAEQITGVPFALEAADHRSRRWNTPPELKVMAQVASNGVVIDTAHVASVDSSADALKRMLDAVEPGELSHLHTSALRPDKHGRHAGWHIPVTETPENHATRVQAAHLNGAIRMSESPLSPDYWSQGMGVFIPAILEEFAAIST